MKRAGHFYRGTASKLWVVLAIWLLVLFGMLLEFRPRRRPQPDVRQQVQFNAMNAALELFCNEFDAYPPSDANDPTGKPYCGSMKLAEALMGRDLLGFHSQSVFRRDGLDATAVVDLYPDDLEGLAPALRDENLKARKGPYVQAENADAFCLADVFGEGKTGPFPEDTMVLCDTNVQKRPSGRRTGMPILYYRADPAGTAHDANDPDNPKNVYDYKDNEALLRLGVPGGEPNVVHPLADPKRFYINTQSHQVASPQPYRKDTFILISAGYDGLYGTADDICNFEWPHR